jgi:hypothetical protein
MPHLGVDPLRPIITPEMGEILVRGVSLPLQNPDQHNGLTIRYRVSAKQASVGPKMVAIGELARRNT